MSVLGLSMVYPLDAHRSFVCPSVRPSAVSHGRAYTRSVGSVANRAPGPPLFFFPIRGPPVLYFLLHAGIPTRALYALLLKGKPPGFPLATLSRPPRVSFLFLFPLSPVHIRVGPRKPFY